MCWAPGTKPDEVGLGHHMLPTSDNFSELQEPLRCPRGQVLRVDKRDAVLPLRHAKPGLLPIALFMALTQKLDAVCPPLSPPSEARSFDPGPGLSAWLLSHLEQFPPEGFLMRRGFLPSGLNPRVGLLMRKCCTVRKSLLLPL